MTAEIMKNKGLEINILSLLFFLLKRLWLIVLVGIITAAMAFAGVKLFISPTYRCSFTAYVNNKHAKSSTDFLSNSDVNAAKELVLTYSQIVRSNTILSAAIEESNLSYTVKQLKVMVGTEILNETEIIKVYAVANSPEEAYKISNAIAGVSPKIVAEIVEGSSMKIVDYPQIPGSIYKPNYFNYTLLGFGIGVLLTIAFLVIIYLRNDTIMDENEVESRFSVPVLGVIPDVHNTGGGESDYY